MEEWFHDCNDKEEVQSSRNEITKVLKMRHRFFPRGDRSNGYCIPKMHGITKMQEISSYFEVL
jgi:hypothetical protein